MYGTSSATFVLPQILKSNDTLFALAERITGVESTYVILYIIQ